MPLKFNCPHCGQPTEVPDEAINRMARCTTCHNTYAVQNVVHRTSTSDRKYDSSLRENLILGFGLGIPAIAFVVFLIYWFGYRDTWETDNFALINQKCDAVLQAVRAGDDLASEAAYLSLDSLIGDRRITGESLVARVKQTRNKYAPVGERLDAIRKEREAVLLTRKRQQEEEAQANEEARLAQLEAAKRERERLQSQGQIRWDMVEKARSTWQEHGLRNASREDQIAVMIVIQVGIEKAVTNLNDREATLDYIQENIDSW